MNSRSVAHASLIQASIYAGVVLLVLLLLTAAQVFLVVFGGILLAILLRSAASWIHQQTGMGEKLSLALAILVPLLVVAVGIWLIAPALSDQGSKLVERLPGALARLKEQLLQITWIARVWQGTEHLQALMPDQSSSARYITGFFSSSLGALGNVLFAVALGLFLSLSPSLYVDGLVQLFPEPRRRRAREVLGATASTLEKWLIAKLIAMAAIGVLTTIGLTLLGIDLALVLGVIAALLSFIPNFGPIASVLPAALIALVISPQKALYVLLLYAAVQAVETYGLTPFLQKRMVQMPPALLLTMQVLLGVVAGILGVILATPLTAAAMVMVKKWYVEDVLQRHHADQQSAGESGVPVRQ